MGIVNFSDYTVYFGTVSSAVSDQGNIIRAGNGIKKQFERMIPVFRQVFIRL
jgi:hypothetical protein